MSRNQSNCMGGRITLHERNFDNESSIIGVKINYRKRLKNRSYFEKDYIKNKTGPINKSN